MIVGFSSHRSSYMSLSRFLTAGRKLLTTTSDSLTSLSIIVLPSGVLRLTAMLRLLRLFCRISSASSLSQGYVTRRSSIPPSTSSTLMMSAPKSPSIWAPIGPAPMREKSRTFTPSNTSGIIAPPWQCVTAATFCRPSFGGTSIVPGRSQMFLSKPTDISDAFAAGSGEEGSGAGPGVLIHLDVHYRGLS